MNQITFDDFIKVVKKYNPEEVEIVTRAYEKAYKAHKGQTRASGEEYIIHPLNVAYMLALIHADRETLCAALLHDTLEDTTLSKEEIYDDFGEEVLKLVEGVTKINVENEEEKYYAYMKKIISSIKDDVRIYMIKLFDTCHNMRTLEFKKDEEKRKQIALRTWKIYVPSCGYLAGYKMKEELEDSSLKYILDPTLYSTIEDYKKHILDKNKDLLAEMSKNVNAILNEKNIPNRIQLRNKNNASIYRKMKEGKSIENIHDLLAFKVLVNSEDDCYLSLGEIHKLYKSFDSEFKDFIRNPKTNMYQSLHTTLFAGDELVQAQIRTNEMDLTARFGLMSYWDIYKGLAKYKMQEDLKTKYQLYESLIQMISMFEDDKEFVIQTTEELLSDNIYVYNANSKGKVIELPKVSNIVDFACRPGVEMIDTMLAAVVNNEFVPFDYQLKNQDIVNIITTDEQIFNREELANIAQTSFAKKMLRKK